MNNRDFHQNISKGISFVVLHYLNFDVTKECVDNLLVYFSSSPIVVVDNGSQNQSGKFLIEEYKNYKNVHVILNPQNVGFAKGNNIGCSYAKQFDTKFYVVLNNDVIINDDRFTEKIERIYSETEFSVLGPDIVTIDGRHQNPIARKSNLCNEAALQSAIKKLQREISFYFLLYLKGQIKRILKKLLVNILSKRLAYRHSAKEEARIMNPLLFGACYIFSKKYIDSHEFVFYPETFMYFEEDILWYQCKKRNDVMVYDGSVSVTHKEAQSTVSANPIRYKRGKNKLINILNSANVFLQLIKESRTGSDEM